jgi:hypothetical protein
MDLYTDYARQTKAPISSARFAFGSEGYYRAWAIAGEIAFVVTAIIFGLLSFKMCDTDTYCRQTYEFVSATFLVCFSAFYYLEIQVAEAPS